MTVQPIQLTYLEQWSLTLRLTQLPLGPVGCYQLHSPSPLTIAQPESWFSLYRSTEGSRLSQPRHVTKSMHCVAWAQGCIMYTAVAFMISTQLPMTAIDLIGSHTSHSDTYNTSLDHRDLQLVSLNKLTPSYMNYNGNFVKTNCRKTRHMTSTCITIKTV